MRMYTRLPSFYKLLNSQMSRCTIQSRLCNSNDQSISTLQEQFEKAKANLNTMKEDPGNEAKLKIYGLFKQATEGSVQSKRPGMMDFVARAKWDAWNAYVELDADAAKQKYIDFVNSLSKAEESAEAVQTASGQKFKNLLVEVEGGLRKITLNRPQKMNAITWEMYEEWSEALTEAKDDPNTVVTVVTGAGPYYCSGNDLSNFTQVSPNDLPKMKEMAENARNVLCKFVGTFIDFPKPLVAVINGPAVGISVTVLGLFDAVYSTDKATFHTPFSSLGQSPEGCSSAIFPKIMGYGNASELLFFNKKITATEAHRLGLVTEVFPDSSFQGEIWPKLKEFSKLPVKSLVYSKELVRQGDREELHKVNVLECDRLVERWLSEDCIKAVMAFFSRKK